MNSNHDKLLYKPLCKSMKYFAAVVNKEVYKDFDNPKFRLGRINQSLCASSPDACKENHQDEDKRESMLDVDFELPNSTQFVENCIYSCFTILNHKIYLQIPVLHHACYYVLHGENERLRSMMYTFLEDFINLHSPCSPDLKGFYLKFLLEKNQYNVGLLQFLIDGIYKIVKNKTNDLSKVKTKKKNLSYLQDCFKEDFNELKDIDSFKYHRFSMETENSDDHDDDDNYDEPEVEHINVTNEEALRRYFILLKLIVKLMEDNLMVNLVVCSFNLKRCINKKETRSVYTEYAPLVVRTTWAHPAIDHPAHVNKVVEDIIYIFHKIEEYSYKDIIFRYIAMLAEIFRIRDHNSSTSYASKIEDRKKEIRYPCIGEYCKNFAMNLAKGFIKGKEDIEEKAIQLISRIEPSWLKLLIANELLKSILRNDFTANLTSIVKILCNCLIGIPKKKPRVCCQDEEWLGFEKKCRCSGYVLVNKIDPKRIDQFLKDINKPDKGALHLACQKGNYHRLKCLLSIDNINVNLKTKRNGLTPLYEAVRAGSKKCTRLLLDYEPVDSRKKLILNVESDVGRTPLMEAVSNNNKTLTRMLIQKGGSDVLFYTNKLGKSVLNYIKDKSMIYVLADTDCFSHNFEKITSFEMSNSVAWLLILMFQAYCETYHLLKIYKTLKDNALDKNKYLGTSHSQFRKGKKKLDAFLSYSQYRDDVFIMIKIINFLNKLRNTVEVPLAVKMYDTIFGID